MSEVEGFHPGYATIGRFVTGCVISLSLRTAYFTFVIDIALSRGQISPYAKAAGGPIPLLCAPHDRDDVAKVPVARVL